MSKRIWIALGVLLVLGVLGTAGAVGAFFYMKAQRLEETFARAEQFYEEENWGPARGNYSAYLWERPDDVETLRKYAYACEQILTRRDRALHDAAAAYFQISLREPDNEDVMRKVIELHYKRRSWSDLEYYAGQFLERWPQDEQLNFYRGLALHRLGRFDDALAIYEELAAEGASIPELYGNYADLELERSSELQAMAVFDQALEQHPGDVGIEIEKAKYLLRRREYDAAKALVASIRENAPDAAGALVLAANLAITDGNLEEGAQLAERAIEQDPTSRGAYLSASSAYDQSGQREKAIELLKELSPEMLADNPEFYLALCELYVAADRLEEAELALDEYREIYPTHGAMFDYVEARLLMARGNASQAATRLTSVVDVAPTFRQGQYYLAVALLEARKREQASAAFEIYLNSNPTDTKAREFYEQEFGGGQRMARIDDETAARVQASGTSSPRALVATAAALFNRKLAQGDLELSLPTITRLIERAIQDAPELSFSYRALIEVLLSTDDLEGAETTLQRALAAGIPESEMRQARAQIALAMDELEKAHSTFSQALNEDELTVNDIARWAEVFAIRGGVENAIRLLRTAAEQREGADAVALELEQVSVAARFNDTERALGLMREYEARDDAPEAMREGLTTIKIELIQQFMAPGEDRDVNLAESLVDELLAKQPNSSRFQLLKAEVLWNQNPPDYEGVERVAQDLLKSNPNDSDVMLTLATLATRKGDHLRAIEFAEQAISRAPDQLEPYVFLAETHMRMRNFPRARTIIEQGMRSHPQAPRLLEMAVEANRLTGRVSEAETAFSTLERVSDDSPAATQRLGLLRAKLLLDRNDDPELVETLLRSQLEEDPADARTALDLTRLLIREDRGDEAESFMMDFAEQNDSQPEAWVALGRFYLNLNTAEATTKASRATTRALLIDRGYAPALLTMIEINLRINNVSDALTFCNRYLEQQPNDDAVLFQKARLIAQGGSQLEEAEAAVDRAIAIQEKTEYSLLRGLIRVALKKFEGGIEDLEQASRATTERAAEVNLALAEAYAELGNLEQAKRYWSAAERQLGQGARLNPQAVERVKALIAEAEAAA